MKKKRNLVFIMLCLAIFSLVLVSANIKPSKQNYDTSEIIYAVSTIGLADNLCRSQDPPENVDLLIVEHKETWEDASNFNVITSAEVPNTKFANKIIWENTQTGTYDLIVDCNDNKRYDEASEPVYSQGFTISAKKGTAKASKGDNNPSNNSWLYDPENPEVVNEILQIKISAQDEDIELGNITLEFENSPGNIGIYVDKNNNGLLNPVDTLIGDSQSFDKTQVIKLDHTLSEGAQENILFVFNLNENSIETDYSFSIESLNGKGVASKENIVFQGNPIYSSTLSVSSKKECLGRINLNLEPNPAFPDSKVTAKISNLTNCNNKRVSLRANPCSEASKREVSFCFFENDVCEIDIKPIKGTYHACIDKNNDGDEKDFGESASEELVIDTPKEIIKIEGEDQEDEDSPVTGEVIQEPNEQTQISLNNPLLVLLEITLLLILFVLILILFSLRGTFSKDNEDSKKEDSSEDKENEEESKEE